MVKTPSKLGDSKEGPRCVDMDKDYQESASKLLSQADPDTLYKHSAKPLTAAEIAALKK